MALGELIPKALRYAWAQVGLALAIGIGLTYVPTNGNLEPLHHVGIGLIVAAAVTTFWQFREFEEFFGQFAQDVLISDKYLEKLNERALSDLRSRAGRAIVKSHVNNPNYERGPLSDWIDELLYSSLLPGDAVGSGIYRDEFNETIALEYPTLAQALSEVGSSPEAIDATELAGSVLKVTTTTTYRAIAPRLRDKRYENYSIAYWGNGADLPHFPLQQRIRVMVGHSEETASELPLAISDEGPGGIEYKGNPLLLKFDEAGCCQVWMRTVEYRAPEREPYMLNSMSMLTRNLHVQIYQTGPGPKLIFDGGLMATGAKRPAQHGISDFSLTYVGWLFEDHGYYIWWWPKFRPA